MAKTFEGQTIRTRSVGIKSPKRNTHTWRPAPVPLPIGVGAAPVLKTITGSTSGEITKLDTTLFANGAYWLQLDATDSTGHTMGGGIWLNVIGDYKPGRVTTTVTDLVVPAPGLPIQISRTYDSLLRATSSDFGFGWSLGIKVQLEIGNTQDVTLTLNGQRRTFYFTPESQGLL